MAKFPMTPRGVQTLKEELKRLREVERPKNVRDIEEARAHGDLKENAEYHAAKERQGFIEGRTRDIESITAVKGADAAIYGVRGANGVIVIKTKGSH